MSKCLQARRAWCERAAIGVIAPNRPIRKAIFLLLLLAFCLPVLQAQLSTGTISGTVTDPSSAAIPSAKLTLVDVDKGFSYAATADSEGRFILRQIPP